MLLVIVVMIMALLMYMPVFVYAQKYERSTIKYFIGNLLFTPIFTGLFLAITIRRQKKNGFVAQPVYKSMLLKCAGLSLLFGCIILFKIIAPMM